MSTTLTPQSVAVPAMAPSPEASTQALLARLLERVEALSAQVERLESLARDAPAALAMVTDAVDDEVRRAREAGVDLDERMRGLLRLGRTVSAPEAVRAMEALAARADRLAPLLELADQAPGMLAMLVDSADEEVRRAGARGLDLDQAARRGAGAALRLAGMMGPRELDGLEALLRSGLLDPAAVHTVAALGRALAAAGEGEPAPAGLLDLWRASRDPEVSRALGFAIRMGRAFGRELPAAAGARSAADAT
jgi:hypothetical protein